MRRGANYCVEPRASLGILHPRELCCERNLVVHPGSPLARTSRRRLPGAGATSESKRHVHASHWPYRPRLQTFQVVQVVSGYFPSSPPRDSSN